MFKFNSVHGGVWRCGYKSESIQKPAVIVNLIGGPKYFWTITKLSVATVITGGYVLVLKIFGLL